MRTRLHASANWLHANAEYRNLGYIPRSTTCLNPSELNHVGIFNDQIRITSMRSQMCTSQYIWLTEPLLGSTWPEWNNKYGVYGAPTVSPPRNSLTNLNQKSNRVKCEMWSEQKKIAPMGRGRPGPEGFGGGKGLHSPLFLFSLFYYWHPFLILISFFSDWGGSWNFLVLTEN